MSEPEKLETASNTAPPIDGQSMPSVPAAETTCVLDSRGDLFVIASGHGSWGSSSPVRFQVCSRTLARSSSTFERMLYGKFAESKPDGPQEWVVTLPSDPAPAMRQLFEIMHGKFRSLDTEASLIHQLYDLVTAADFYDSVAMLRPLDHPWISNLRGQKYEELSDMDLLGKAWIFYQLGRVADYEKVATHLVLDASPAVLSNCQVEQDGSLPLAVLPPFLLENVSKLRLQITTRLLKPLYNTVTVLLEGNTSPLGICLENYRGYLDNQQWAIEKIDCEQRLLGLLLRELHRLCLFPQTKAADVKQSPRAIHNAIQGLTKPRANKTTGDSHWKCVLKLEPGSLGTAGKDGRSAKLGTFNNFKYVADAKEVEFMAR